ncbi:hypothetical protein BCD49_24935 [Pseudofrankia sp. EUN1h]|nr:hypothetical protein BCD49_24935 [Pseudofrankia sp. EUN1h]
MDRDRRSAGDQHNSGPLVVEPEQVTITLADAISAFRDLNEFVVSLDRIGSRIGGGNNSPDILYGYIVSHDVGPRLARLRRMLGDALESAIGEDEVDRIGESSYFYTDD